MTTTLVLDTTLNGLTLAIAQEGKVVASFLTEEPRSGAILHPHLQALLKQCGLKAQDLQNVTLTIGPGSFTGIRLGLAVAHALKLAHLHLTLTAVSTLQAAAQQFAHLANPTLTLWLDAAGGTVYTQTFDKNACALTQPEISTQPEAEASLQKTALVAASTLLTDADLAATLTVLSPEAILAAAQKPANHRPLQPFYLKPLTYKVQHP